MSALLRRDQALAVARRRCAEYDVELVLPDDPRRRVVAFLVGEAHAIQKTGVTREHVAQNVTVTLPGVPGAAAALLSMIPTVGPALAGFAASQGRTAIFASPAWLASSGEEQLATIEHELGHAGTIKAGGLAFCLAYLLAAEVRAGTETPCFGASMAVLHGFGLYTVDEVEERALRSLAGYGLDANATILARGLIQQAAETIRATGDLGGVWFELQKALGDEGVFFKD